MHSDGRSQAVANRHKQPLEGIHKTWGYSGRAVRGKNTQRRLTARFFLNHPEGCLNREEKRHKTGRLYA